MALFDFSSNRLELALHSFINKIRSVITRDRTVRWNTDNIHVVDVAELLFFRFRCTSHTSKLVVHTEVVLERNRRERHALTLNL